MNDTAVLDLVRLCYKSGGAGQYRRGMERGLVDDMNQKNVVLKVWQTLPSGREICASAISRVFSVQAVPLLLSFLTWLLRPFPSIVDGFFLSLMFQLGHLQTPCSAYNQTWSNHRRVASF